MDRSLDQSFAFMFAAVQKYLTSHQAQCIIDQFTSDSWIPNRQVLWESVNHGEVESWAKVNGMQTLSIALGPLIEDGNPRNLRDGMNASRTQKFMRGAGALFTWYISLGDEVIIISRPPPNRFHPGHNTNFQQNELPILRTAIENCSLRVYMVHPEIEKAKKWLYEVWPSNLTRKWNKKYSKEPYTLGPWRTVSKKPIGLEPLKESAITEADNIRIWVSIRQIRGDTTCKNAMELPASPVKVLVIRFADTDVQTLASTSGSTLERGIGKNDGPRPPGIPKAFEIRWHDFGSHPNNNTPNSKAKSKRSKNVKGRKNAPQRKCAPDNTPDTTPSSKEAE